VYANGFNFLCYVCHLSSLALWNVSRWNNAFLLSIVAVLPFYSLLSCFHECLFILMLLFEIILYGYFIIVLIILMKLILHVVLILAKDFELGASYLAGCLGSIHRDYHDCFLLFCQFVPKSCSLNLIITTYFLSTLRISTSPSLFHYIYYIDYSAFAKGDMMKSGCAYLF
jgi:hypothetical protein